MTRPDGRIEKGQKLATAISARAWNRAQDAADRVLGATPGAVGEAASVLSLPCVRGQFVAISPECFFVYRAAHENGDTLAQASPNIASWSDVEKKMVAATTAAIRVEKVSPMPVNAAYDDDHFMVNIDNGNTFAISGFAVARVRVFDDSHRYARLPLQHPGIDNSAAVGALDSVFFGRVRIVGYLEAALVIDRAAFRHAFPPTVAYPQFQMRWALIQF